MLEAVLAIGSLLTSGAGRRGPHGFKVEALYMLSSVKDAKGNTLLDYLFGLLTKNASGLLPPDGMSTLERSSELSLEEICDEVDSLLASVNSVSEHIKLIGDDPIPPFSSRKRKYLRMTPLRYGTRLYRYAI